MSHTRRNGAETYKLNQNPQITSPLHHTLPTHPHPFLYKMFFSASFISAALMVLSTVEAVPQGPGNGLSARATCSAGYYPNYSNNGACTICPPGNYCSDGNSISKCGTGQYQPKNGTTTVCPNCPAGYYQPNLGQSSCIPAPAGSFVPYPGASSAALVSGGHFQSQTAKSFTCKTCCGYGAKTNGNTVAQKCPANYFANVGDGNGCTQNKATCKVPASCVQSADGTCPATEPGSAPGTDNH
ncbi:hypothetical protein DFH07DRAFT_1067582 [Mycena maculata]|uniref:Tyrosine-protein kinase ephrin type A/B receptor-like domain-containing protein n=1 Tax=Mycena maculata TaxID=230809 RepID=A0AAD7MKP3_9AGAR|nr:hypothetical protein DFH07DRAFT_1067582 [Mycena maculata]